MSQMLVSKTRLMSESKSRFMEKLDHSLFLVLVSDMYQVLKVSLSSYSTLDIDVFVTLISGKTCLLEAKPLRSKSKNDQTLESDLLSLQPNLGSRRGLSVQSF